MEGTQIPKRFEIDFYSMEILYSSRFQKCYRKLVPEIQDLADKRIEIFIKNSFDSRLKTHKLNGVMETFWAFSVNYKIRIIFEFIDKNKAKFYSIGNHDIYE